MGASAWLLHAPGYGDARRLVVLTISAVAAGSIASFADHPPTLSGLLVLRVPRAWALSDAALRERVPGAPAVPCGALHRAGGVPVAVRPIRLRALLGAHLAATGPSEPIHDTPMSRA